MCGRYAAFKSVDEIRRIFATTNAPPNLDPTWNMAPTRLAPVVRLDPQSHERNLSLLHWGLVPHWAKDKKAVRQPINARSETAATSPMFRDALARRRAIVPIAAAGLWEGWRGADGEILRTFTIMTTAANPALRHLHERMPVVLEPADWPVWLGEAEGDFATLLRPSAAEFRVWRVGMSVNNVRNDWPGLLDKADQLV